MGSNLYSYSRQLIKLFVNNKDLTLRYALSYQTLLGKFSTVTGTVWRFPKLANLIVRNI